MAKELTSENINLAKKGVALVDFWAPWCGPCRMLAPAIEELANEFEGKALVAKVNIDDCEELAAEFGIRSVPTMLFFKNGEIVDTVIGAQAKQALADKLNSLL
ncbi:MULTISPECIES: thioredoxin [unclassified Campylobacter]|uniref:thioredoxin n=1 Tax=unclassified Campylobacter TaxID=2593542 RepID=UPI001BDB0677|nr:MULTISPECIES: thioredoxin [unclassified Campylobacter]MBZ7976653.1 thioredoxin [Campylobacter sp. RM12637]MBZ7978307.1 thioredoxin [Campylobacter sp. RM12654]MBZ7979309.1 thioredoxin [Campylobacter sp. RM12642]MBZ7981316.1 thioredoxin [Campylobacter sp. RM12640]MBZ7984033.1 thioredoxin [Campylobacter sp. RM12647]MBZ7989141.1 thioredoxin [Campylobacter sp. RM12635]MBZ7991301.1 thioredoxin [Campylobacter sp. RM9331]MBZ7993062.1 thioredoxin [Campylobacter sp. RM9333]MBZ8005899.1 thioredoxi